MEKNDYSIAYLIAAHDKPQLLARLVNRLDHPSVFFYIHVDKKVDIKPFLNEIGSKTNVIFIKKRIRVFWRGYSQVRATHEMLRSAIQSKAKYFILLSGTDYPVKPNQEILQFLDGNDTEYIHFFSLSDFPKWPVKIKKYYYWDSKATNPRHGYERTRKFYYKNIHKRILWRLPNRKFLTGMKPYGGSSWWMLTRACAQYCLQTLEENKKFIQFYRYTDAPDEMVFQTIVLNSTFKEKVVNYSDYIKDYDRVLSEVLSKPLGDLPYHFRYIDWYHPERGFPAFLDETNFDEITSSNAMFARKMDPVVSDTLLERIDSKLL